MNFSALARSVSERFKSTSKKKPSKSSEKSSYDKSSNCSSVDQSCSDDNDEEEVQSANLATAAEKLVHRRQPYQQIVEQILHQVSELEHTLYEDQQEEFKLRLTLERQTERINELNFSLDTEKQRNNRLVQLLRNGNDNCSLSDEHEMAEAGLFGVGSPVKLCGDLYESISPLLMQQRYDELAASHRQSRRQLAKKESALKNLQCENEELKAKYNELFDEFRKGQRRFEMVCARYLQMTIRKKQQIMTLKNTLTCACQCLFHAQEIIDIYVRHQKQVTSKHYAEHLQKYSQNFECFLIALRHCCSERKLRAMQLEKQQQKLNPQKSASSIASSDATLVCANPRPKSHRSKTKVPNKPLTKKTQ
ncbi:uncharacterized protein LOC6645733 [Drosophila willistoni]|uniref:uncharacterized protein LOC6645733 n=1 Tax=Drosophila willistoni TaxID=7260 RepID=UPI000C26C8AF|nr:uncharacterized protein LOC6645733 [Drosophila willistoni]